MMWILPNFNQTPRKKKRSSCCLEDLRFVYFHSQALKHSPVVSHLQQVDGPFLQRTGLNKAWLSAEGSKLSFMGHFWWCLVMVDFYLETWPRHFFTLETCRAKMCVYVYICLYVCIFLCCIFCWVNIKHILKMFTLSFSPSPFRICSWKKHTLSFGGFKATHTSTKCPFDTNLNLSEDDPSQPPSFSCIF